LLADLLADHEATYGRPATAAERVPLEAIARGMVAIRRLEAQGKSSFQERKQLAQWWRAIFKDKPTSNVDRHEESLESYLARTEAEAAG
jgi:hypothetical protein